MMWMQDAVMAKEREDQNANDVTGAWPVDIPAVLDTDIQVKLCEQIRVQVNFSRPAVCVRACMRT